MGKGLSDVEKAADADKTLIFFERMVLGRHFVMKYGIAVDLGATNVRVIAGCRDGRIIARIMERTNLMGGPEAVSRQIIRLIKRICRENTLKLEDADGIGVGAFGPQDPIRGGISRPANAPYEFIPIREPLTEEFKVPVEVMNDCLVAAIGERFYGAGRGIDNFVYITISTGIGAGVYVDGHVLLGKDGNAHEIGHIVVDYERRLLCGCGKRGHWEAYCSGKNIPNYARLIIEEENLKDKFRHSYLYKASYGKMERVTAKAIYDGAKIGDFLCEHLVNRIGEINAMGVASAINVYDPSVVILGGAVVLNNVEQVLTPIRMQFKDYIVNREAEVKVTPLKGDVVLYGALAMAFGLHKKG